MIPGTQQTLEEDFRVHLQEFGLRFDPVTGLPNSVSFHASISRLLAESAASGRQIALIWVDLLNLRREYSISGEEGTRRLICTVADALRPWIDPGELISRFSDSCFLLALSQNEDTEARLNVVLDAAAHRHLRGSESKPEIAAGVAHFPQDATSSEELIRFASLAAVSAARTRSHSAVHFVKTMNTSLLLERELERDLRHALQTNQLSLAYQPQIDLTSGNVIGVEGLTRWTHPERGFVSPAQFIPVAENSELIQEIFVNSLRRLLADVEKWRAAGFVLPSVAVNASPANVRHEGFVATVERELALHPLEETQLDIEVTESLLIDDEPLFLERLTALRAIGVKVSLDDFGTRYTGFNALKGMPLNTMKIDKCFVHDIDRSSQAQSLCGTIVTMARHLNLETIAEGIESLEELKILKSIGCPSGQGYLFQRPVSSDRFVEFLQEWPERRTRGQFQGVFDAVEYDASLEADPLFGLV